MSNFDQIFILTDIEIDAIIARLLEERYRVRIAENISMAEYENADSFCILLENILKEMLYYYWRNLASMFKTQPRLYTPGFINEDSFKRLHDYVYPNVILRKIDTIAFSSSGERQRYVTETISKAIYDFNYLIASKISENTVPLNKASGIINLERYREHRN